MSYEQNRDDLPLDDETVADTTTGWEPVDAYEPQGAATEDDWGAEPEYETGDGPDPAYEQMETALAEMQTEGEDALARAKDAARDARRSFASGIDAFRSVHEASQRHSSARDDLKSLRKTHAENADELSHRLDIEARYGDILSEQTAEFNEATALYEQRLAAATDHDAQKASLEQQLDVLKKQNEEQLRPYRNVAESTKGRADDAARALADGRRALKAADGDLSDAKRQREQRIAAANAAVDSANARLRKMEGELRAEQARENSSPEAVAKLQNELVSVRAHLDAARDEVPVETEKARRAVEDAQQRVFDLQAQLEQLEADAEQAKREATERRDEYDALLKQCQDAERALSDQIKQHGTAAEQARKEMQEANDRIEIAQALLTEAEQIHSTPQLTIDLRNLVDQEQREMEELESTVHELADDERELRRSTFKQRLLVILAIVAAAAIVIGIIFIIVSSTTAH